MITFRSSCGLRSVDFKSDGFVCFVCFTTFVILFLLPQSTDPYLFEVEENGPVRFVIGQVKATDADIEENARIYYFIIGNFFRPSCCSLSLYYII